MPHWHGICRDLAADPRLCPGTPLNRRLKEDGWSIASPTDLVHGIFDTKFKLNVDRMGLDPQSIRDICAWIIEILHYRQCAADLRTEQVVDQSDVGHRPSFGAPIGNMRAYAWRMFSSKAAALPSVPIDEDEQAQGWVRRHYEHELQVQSISPRPQLQEGREAATSARGQPFQRRQSEGSSASISTLDEGTQHASDWSGRGTNAGPARASTGLDEFAAGFQAAANYLLLGEQGNKEEDDAVTLPHYQLLRLLDLLSQLLPYRASDAAT